MIKSDLLILIKKVEEWSPNSVYLRGTEIEHIDKLCDLIPVFLADAHLRLCESEKLKQHSEKKLH